MIEGAAGGLAAINGNAQDAAPAIRIHRARGSPATGRESDVRDRTVFSIGLSCRTARRAATGAVN